MLEGVSEFLFSSTTQEEKAWNFNKSWDKIERKEVLESEELEKDNEQLQQELSACQHFFDDTEIEIGRHQEFNFKLSKFDPHEINKKS